MLTLCLGLLLLAFALALPATWAARRLGRTLGALDSAGGAGHVKALRNVPNTGGIAIYLALALPIAGGLAWVWFAPSLLVQLFAPLGEHLPGIRAQTPLAMTLLGCLTVLHITGVIDDRRALPPLLKLVVMTLCAAAVVALSDTRLLSAADAITGLGFVSALLTILWLVAVTNALNFMDNMDGLAGGVGLVTSLCFLTAAVLQGQWFVAACLALLAGALAGFLCFNTPPASIFMGDGGSLVLGFMLAFLTVRTTYLHPQGGAPAGGWHAVFMPLVVLAVPLYDLVSVVLIRLSQGRKPWVGDQQHLSHRFTALGLSVRSTVLVICGLTAVTGLSGIVLASVASWQAGLIGLQTFTLLGVLGLFEWRRARPTP